MLRLQAKQEKLAVLSAVQKGDSQVSHVPKDLPQVTGTVVKTSFIQQRESSWQLHLQRISPFLLTGVNTWWSMIPNGFQFHDGDADPDYSGNIVLLHYRYQSVEDVEQRRDACWKKIVVERIPLPTHSIKLFDSEGNKTGRLLYNNNKVTFEHASDSLATNPSNHFAYLFGESAQSSNVPAHTFGESAHSNDSSNDSACEPTHSSNDSAHPVSESTHSSNDSAHPFGEPTHYSHDTAHHFGESAAPFGESTPSSNVSAHPFGESAHSSHDSAHSVDESTHCSVYLSKQPANKSDGHDPSSSGITRNEPFDLLSAFISSPAQKTPSTDPSAVNSCTSTSHLAHSSDRCSSFINLHLEEHQGGLKTTLGNSINRLLGCDDDLSKFDALRFQLKAAKKAGSQGSHIALSSYNELAKKIGTKVRSTQQRLADEVKQTEYKHFKEHRSLPPKISGSHYSKLLKERNLATAILRNISA